MLSASGHVDTFARDNLPSADLWPELDMRGLPDYPNRLNCAGPLLDDHVAAGRGNRPVLYFEDTLWTYAELQAQANRIAHVLVDEMGVVPGNRVMLRAANTPMLVAAWFAVAKAGAVAVATMPLLRARELSIIAEKARVDFALCDSVLKNELEAAREAGGWLSRVLYWGEREGLDKAMARASPEFAIVATAADDVVLIAFTSGTTGAPKGCMHFHRDVMAMCDTYARHILKPRADDIFCGGPPLAFTFGLGGLTIFPMYVGAATALTAEPGPVPLMETIARHRATVCFTAPTAYRAMASLADEHDLSSLRTCVSAGETLPKPTFELWQQTTGVKLLDGIGATEMLHIFIAAPEAEIRPGATGKPVPGYQARVVDDTGRPTPAGVVGRLAVKGPTGCRYLADPERQATYVQDGWNLTGDAYMCDEDGYFWYQARTDDMIISSGYNIAGPEVEAALLDHPLVSECAVIASPHEERGQIPKAFVVLSDDGQASEATAKELQDFVKSQIAPYKYPRAVAFVDRLPRTETGKVQRFKLRRQEFATG